MKAPGREAAKQLLQKAHDAHRCCIPNSDAERRLLCRAVQCGLAVRPARGIYADALQWDKLNENERALYQARALCIVHPSWVFAGTTAALAHDLWVSYQSSGRLCRVAPAASHHCSSIHMDLVRNVNDTFTIRHGIRVTSFVRTVFDCLATLPFPEALAIADSALRAKTITCERLAENLKQICADTLGLQRALAIVALADARSENGGESMARAKMISLGFAIPDLQREIPDPLNPSKNYRQDFIWELPDNTLIVGELDGRDKYIDPAMLQDKDSIDALLAERRREARLTLQNQPVRVVRFSFAESQNRPFFERLLSSYGIPRTETIPDVARL